MVLIIEGYFGALTVKSSHNSITTQNMANLHNAVQCVQIVVFSYSSCPYRQSDILKLLL